MIISPFSKKILAVARQLATTIVVFFVKFTWYLGRGSCLQRPTSLGRGTCNAADTIDSNSTRKYRRIWCMYAISNHDVAMSLYVSRSIFESYTCICMLIYISMREIVHHVHENAHYFMIKRFVPIWGLRGGNAYMILTRYMFVIMNNFQ